MRIVWYRNDLRTRDHEALTAAVSQGPVCAVFLWSKAQWQSHDVGAPRLAFLRRSLLELDKQLRTLNVPLLIAKAERFADAPRVLLRIAKSLQASHIHCIEEFPLNERVRDSKVAIACEDAGIELLLHDGGALIAPGSVLKDNGEPYSVFSAFKRRWAQQLSAAHRQPLRIPKPAPKQRSDIGTISQVALRSDPCLDLKRPFDGVDASLLAQPWPAGESEAHGRLKSFIRASSQHYQEQRDLPSVAGTSTLSPYLAIGAISARQCLAAGYRANDERLFSGNPGISTWISELVWRDFYRHVVTHFPHVNKHQAFRRETDQLRWRTDADDLAAWQEARTGYPLVDAAMVQLRETGWMHNRLRMVTAMFLSKHLLLDWRLGERFFMQSLIDGDFAANNGGWQWSASTGTDAAPYFRIFNPTTQAQRYDPEGHFVLAQLPQLKPLARHLPKKKKWFFEPWTAPEMPNGYCLPIVDHKAARERALNAFKGA